MPLPSPPPRSEGRELLLRNYQRGRKVHWSGFSSATRRRDVAVQFAGDGGVLLRVDLLPHGSRARDISALSALRPEEEASRRPRPHETSPRPPAPAPPPTHPPPTPPTPHAPKSRNFLFFFAEVGGW